MQTQQTQPRQTPIKVVQSSQVEHEEQTSPVTPEIDFGDDDFDDSNDQAQTPAVRLSSLSRPVASVTKSGHLSFKDHYQQFTFFVLVVHQEPMEVESVAATPPDTDEPQPEQKEPDQQPDEVAENEAEEEAEKEAGDDHDPSQKKRIADEPGHPPQPAKKQKVQTTLLVGIEHQVLQH